MLAVGKHFSDCWVNHGWQGRPGGWPGIMRLDRKLQRLFCRLPQGITSATPPRGFSTKYDSRTEGENAASTMSGARKILSQVGRATAKRLRGKGPKTFGENLDISLKKYPCYDNN